MMLAIELLLVWLCLGGFLALKAQITIESDFDPPAWIKIKMVLILMSVSPVLFVAALLRR